MRVEQWKIGQAMVEMRRIQLHDIRRAALMLGMAGAALPRADVVHVAVIAMMPADIRRDLLVAIQAQGSLACTLVRSWQLLQVASNFACELATGPGISNVSTETAPAGPAGQ